VTWQAGTSGSGTVTEQPVALTPEALQPRILWPVHARRTAWDPLQLAPPFHLKTESCSWVEELKQLKY
jgi:hypothetical protein